MFPSKLIFLVPVIVIIYCSQDLMSVGISGQRYCPGVDDNFCRRNYPDGVTPQSPNDLNELEFKKHRCFCDEECWKYGDCCKDVPRPRRQSIKYGNLVKKTCHRITYNSYKVYVIKTCRVNWKDDSTRLLCERKVDRENYHPVLDIPFFSRSSEKPYLNIYCAKCNDDASNGFILKLNVSCMLFFSNCTDYFKEMNNGYQPGELKWEFENHFYLEARVEDPEFDKFRRCREVVDTCASNWTDSAVVKLCQNYSLHIQNNKSGVMYKNIHCAKCNYENIDNLHCPTEEYRHLAGRGRQQFSWLMDFTLGSQCLLGSEIYDEYLKKCIPITCGQNYELIGGKCLLKNNTFNMSANSCIRVSVPISEFSLFTNGSMYRNRTQILYSRHEVELINNNTLISVCVDDDVMMLQNLGVRQFSAIQSRLSMVCMAISLICLAAHIIIHCIMGKQRKLPGKTLLNLSVALFFGQLLFFFGVTRTENEHVCYIIAVLIHFTFLAAFFWMNIMAVDICRTFTRSYHKSSWNSKTFFYYCTYAWLIPLIIVIAAVTIDRVHPSSNIRPRYGHGVCWISDRYALFIFFALPLSIILTANVILFTITAYSIHKTVKMNDNLKKSSECKRFHVYVKLAVVVGLTWIVGFAAAFTDFEPLWYGFIILNASQGAFIFVVFTLKHRVLRQLCEKLTGKPITRTSSSSKRSEFTSLKQMSSTNANDEKCIMLTTN